MEIPLSARYVYIEGQGWLNIELLPDKIRKDSKKLTRTWQHAKKIKLSLSQEVS